MHVYSLPCFFLAIKIWYVSFFFDQTYRSFNKLQASPWLDPYENNSGAMPIIHPMVIPITRPDAITIFVFLISSCVLVRWGMWIPNLLHKLSTRTASHIPQTSETKLPRAAAAIVDIWSICPNSYSIRSPAKIIIQLSKNPNPMNGQNPHWNAVTSWAVEGGVASWVFSFSSIVFLSSSYKSWRSDGKRV